MEPLPSFWPHRGIALGAFVWFGKRGSPTRRPLLPRNAGTAEPVRVSPPEAVAYPLELRLSASLEDLDYRHPRGLDKSLMLRLASCQWVHERHNVLVTGPTGIGKTWLACALGHQACREGYTVLYLRLPRLLQELPIAKGDGRYPKLMAALAKTALLILDDWGLATLNDENRRDVLELLEDRHGRGATLVTSQFPVDHWHEALGDPTLADAILDRLLHNAYKITLRGESMRKRHATVKNDVPAM